MTATAIPPFVADSDFTVVGSLADVTTVDRATVRRLLRQVDGGYLKALVRSEPSEGFELLVGDDVTSLWYAGQRLAVISNRKDR